MITAALLLAAAGQAVDTHLWTVLPGSAVSQILRQCSRAAPLAGESTWQPGRSSVLALEAALPTALATAKGRYAQHPPDLNGYHRQYVGIVRNGRRFIYGNFFPIRPSGAPSPPPAKPVLVCDGGGRFFGVEWDVADSTFTRVDFNGI